VPDAEEAKTNKEAKASERSLKMAYKKPQIVAKSAAKQSFVAGCGTSNVPRSGCENPTTRASCQMGKIK
jgi:hypothetical protein